MFFSNLIIIISAIIFIIIALLIFFLEIFDFIIFTDLFITDSELYIYKEVDKKSQDIESLVFYNIGSNKVYFNKFTINGEEFIDINRCTDEEIENYFYQTYLSVNFDRHIDYNNMEEYISEIVKIENNVSEEELEAEFLDWKNKIYILKDKSGDNYIFYTSLNYYFSTNIKVSELVVKPGLKINLFYGKLDNSNKDIEINLEYHTKNILTSKMYRHNTTQKIK